MSLQQQIQIEIDEEARIDRKIELFKKKFLKQKSNRKYKLVPTRKDANMIVIFDRTNITKYDVVLNDETDESLKSCEASPRYTMVYLKNKNPRDVRLNTIGDITCCPYIIKK